MKRYFRTRLPLKHLACALSLVLILAVGTATPAGARQITTAAFLPSYYFSKISPANGSTGVPTSLTLSWEETAGIIEYVYCYDTIENVYCDGGGQWISAGTNTSVAVSGLSDNTTYFWQVRALTQKGWIIANNNVWWSFTTSAGAPGAFSKISPINGAAGIPTNPTLSWGSSAGANSYEYCIDNNNNNACDSTWINTGANTSVALSGLNNGTTYYWQARATNTLGSTEANGGTWWSFTTQIAPPGAFNKTSPTNAATGISINPTLIWGSSSGASSYEYCYDMTNNSACDGTWTSTGGNTSVALIGLSYATTYYWQVRATNAAGTTYANNGTWWSFTTQTGQPAAFSKTSPTNAASNVSLSPTLSWGASSGATSYDYCYDTTNNSACDVSWISTGANTSIALSGLSYSTTYYWQVRATNAQGTTYANNGTWWRFTTVTPLLDAYEPDNSEAQAKWIYPGTPQNHSIIPALDVDWVKFLLTETSAVTLETSAGTPGGDTRMWLYDSEMTLLAFNDDNGTDFYSRIVRSCGSDALPAGLYYVKVNDYDDEIPSYLLSLTTTPCLPDSFGKTSPANGASGISTSPTLSWQSSSGATSYEYCYDTTNNNDCDSTWTSTGSDTNVSLSGLGTSTYFWQVRAVNVDGNTYADSGAWWSFSTSSASGDNYEPDDTWEQAQWIFPGSPQEHSIDPATDIDWVKFTLAEESQVILATSGPIGHDTRMWLYDETLTEIEYNDDGGEGMWAAIDRQCGTDPLPAGTYYAKIDEFNNNNIIPSYQLSLSVSPCPAYATYLPLVSNASLASAPPAELPPPKEEGRSQPYDRHTSQEPWEKHNL